VTPPYRINRGTVGGPNGMHSRKLLIFDFDGTIADTPIYLVTIMNKLAERYGYKTVEPHEHEILRGMSARQVARHLNISFFKLPLLVRRFRQEVRREIDALQPVRGMIALITRLRQKGYNMAIVSSNTEENISRFLRNNYLDVFKYIHCDRRTARKDRALATFLRRHGIPSHDAVYIGDEHRDIVACRKVGIPIIAVTWGFNSPSYLMQGDPDYIVTSPEELLSTVERVAG